MQPVRGLRLALQPLLKEKAKLPRHRHGNRLVLAPLPAKAKRRRAVLTIPILSRGRRTVSAPRLEPTLGPAPD